MTVNVTRPDIRSVSTSKSTKEVVTHTQVPTVVVADVGQAGPRGGVGNTGGKGDTGDRGLQGDSGIFVGNAPPSIDTILWADTTTTGDSLIGPGTPGDEIVAEPCQWFHTESYWGMWYSGPSYRDGVVYDNGVDGGIGATLTAGGNYNINVWKSVDDATVWVEDGLFSGGPAAHAAGIQVGDRILYIDTYTDDAFQGVYVVTDLGREPVDGDPGVPFVLTRATDFDDATDAAVNYRIDLVGSPFFARTSRRGDVGEVDSFGSASSKPHMGFCVMPVDGFASGYGALALSIGSVAIGEYASAGGRALSYLTDNLVPALRCTAIGQYKGATYEPDTMVVAAQERERGLVQSSEGAHQRMWRVNLANANLGPFTSFIHPIEFGGAYDQVWYQGYNVAYGGVRERTGEPAVFWAMEVNRKFGAEHFEHYFTYYDPTNIADAGGIQRPIFMSWNKDTGAMEEFRLTNRGTHFHWFGDSETAYGSISPSGLVITPRTDVSGGDSGIVIAWVTGGQNAIQIGNGDYGFLLKPRGSGLPQWEFRVAQDLSLELGHPYNEGWTSVSLLANLGGGDIDNRLVYVGAADSAGAGFRALKVSN